MSLSQLILEHEPPTKGDSGSYAFLERALLNPNTLPEIAQIYENLIRHYSPDKLLLTNPDAQYPVIGRAAVNTKTPVVYRSKGDIFGRENISFGSIEKGKKILAFVPLLGDGFGYVENIINGFDLDENNITWISPVERNDLPESMNYLKLVNLLKEDDFTSHIEAAESAPNLQSSHPINAKEKEKYERRSIELPIDTERRNESLITQNVSNIQNVGYKIADKVDVLDSFSNIKIDTLSAYVLNNYPFSALYLGFAIPATGLPGEIWKHPTGAIIIKGERNNSQKKLIVLPEETPHITSSMAAIANNVQKNMGYADIVTIFDSVDASEKKISDILTKPFCKHGISSYGVSYQGSIFPTQHYSSSDTKTDKPFWLAEKLNNLKDYIVH